MDSLVNNLLAHGVLLDEGALSFIKNMNYSEDFVKFAKEKAGTIKDVSNGFPIINKEKITVFFDNVSAEFKKTPLMPEVCDFSKINNTLKADAAEKIEILPKI